MNVMSPVAIRAHRVKRALAHQCPTCRRHWALRVIDHPAGKVILCSHCSAIKARIPAALAAEPA